MKFSVYRAVIVVLLGAFGKSSFVHGRNFVVFFAILFLCSTSERISGYRKTKCRARRGSPALLCCLKVATLRSMRHVPIMGFRHAGF
jgi:hypothetical protein